MAQPKKRKSDVISVSSDSGDENRAQDHKKIKRENAPAHATPPASSQPLRSSQGRTANTQSRGIQPQASLIHSEAERESWLEGPPAAVANLTSSQRNRLTSTQQRALDDEISSSIDQSQNDDHEDPYEHRQLYGTLKTKIVGIRFYDGEATVGEYVLVRREPGNPYDSNAIRIDNVAKQQIGHIGREMAAKLAPFIDSRDLLIEGSLNGERADFTCPIALKLLGTNQAPGKWELRSKMVQSKLPVKDFDKAENARQRREKEREKQQRAREKAMEKMRKQGTIVDENEEPSRYGNLRPDPKDSQDEPQIGDLLDGTTTYNPRELQKAFNKFAVSEDELAKLKLADQPEQIATKLLPYQRQGLQWMLEHESPHLPATENSEVTQFWKKTRGGYLNIVTNFLVRNNPELASGGILADDMGLGKTIQTLSLIMTDPKKNGQPTLIISPLSVMSNWKNQAALHTKKRYAPNVLIYHGAEKRGLGPNDLKDYDIVVTTYQTMTLEIFADKKDEPKKVPTSKGLFSLRWRRVVLDEGHHIRNPRAKMSRAAQSLMADSRWVLTGTPIINNLKDLYSHVNFLHVSGGLEEFEIFNANIIRPVKEGDPNGKTLLRALMQTLCLRRMKDMDFVNLKLPTLTYHKTAVRFLKHEQERYDAFRAEAKGLVEAAKAKKDENPMTCLLEVLLRMRQTCNHSKMCGEERISELMSLIEHADGETVDLINPANKQALQDLLQLRLDSQEDCSICLETLSERDGTPVITACAHAFCKDCIDLVIAAQHKCPICRAALPGPDLLVYPRSSTDAESALKISLNESSSKVEALIDLLRATDSEDTTTKTIVFSQWTSFLDIIEPHLERHKLEFTRLDGRLSPLKRDLAIERLSNEPKCRIMLASLSACSVGINLTAACQVVLADSWWAPAVEDQAVDRVYRLGQQRKCRVVRLVMEGSVEEEVLEVQKKKRELVDVAFADSEMKRKRGEDARRERLDEIERLLG